MPVLSVVWATTRGYVKVVDISCINLENMVGQNPELREFMSTAKKPFKYHNLPQISDRIRFDSGHDAKIWGDLKLMLRAGEALCAAYHVRFLVSPPDSKPIYYEADFVWLDKHLVPHIWEGKVDVTKTHAYRIKKKLFEAKYAPVKIEEV